MNLPQPADYRRLPVSHPSLRTHAPRAVPGTVFVLAVGVGGIAMSPKEGRQLLFGRNSDEVHVCVGEDDTKVSRLHGVLVYQGGRWWVRNLGRLPVQIGADRTLFADEEPVPLAAGFSALRVHGSNNRQHVIEVHVASDERLPAPRPDVVTEQPQRWALDDDERLVLTVLGRRYLRQEPYPQPLSWRQTELELAELAPEKGWNAKHVERVVTAVRQRISAAGGAGLTREEVGEPVGNVVNHNLLVMLLQTTTLSPADLRLIDER